jgi:light-regulated signal transduction histidine kinase (bacteriophytochrome)
MTEGSPKKITPLLSHSAHEIRTPLSVILGYIGFVLRDKKTALSPTHREWLETAYKSCGRLTDLANELSELSRLESRDPPLTFAATDIRALLSEAIAGLPAPAERNVDIELSTGHGPSIVQADGPRLRKAFASVVSALRLQTVLSPTLFVEERTAHHAGTAASWIVIADDVDQVSELRDAAPESLGKFNPSIGNTGMSLWIAQQVLSDHGGAIWGPIPRQVLDADAEAIFGSRDKAAAVLMVPLA